jgi:UDP-glucose 4-epimerase
VLVTGGAGFIGSNLVAGLIRNGCEVSILDNLSSGYRSNIPDHTRVRFDEGDVRDEVALKDAIAGAEVVFHLAASVGNKRSIDNPLQDAQINVIGTLHVLEAARSAKVRKIVVSSSAGIFGELKTLPIREDHPIEPDSPYGCTKLCEEKESLVYSKLGWKRMPALFQRVWPNQRYDAMVT